MLAVTYISTPEGCSIISDDVLDFLVRYGAGYFHICTTTNKYLNLFVKVFNNLYKSVYNLYYFIISYNRLYSHLERWEQVKLNVANATRNNV